MIKFALPILSLLILTACQTQQALKPQSTTAWLDLQSQTIEQLKQKNFGSAEMSIKEMMTIAGDEFNRWEYIRMALVSMPSDLAMPLADDALGIKSIKKSDQQLFGFSKVYTHFKKLEKALDIVNQAIDIKKEENYVFWRARLLLMLKKHALAELDYQWLLVKNSEKEEYISQYATLLNYLERPEEAQQLLERHINNPDLLYKSIILALRQEQESEAQNQYTQLKSILSETSDLDDQKRLEIGELAYWLQDPEYSMMLLSEIKSGDKISQAQLIMGNVQMSLEHYDRAIALYRQAQNGSAEQAAMAYLLEAQAHRELDETHVAMRTLNQALQLFPEHSDLRYSRAMLFEMDDSLVEMEKDLTYIISHDKTHYDALNALGYSWADRNIKLTQALEYIEKANALSPDSMPILDSLGWVHYRLGNLEKARTYLMSATKNDPNDRLLYDHLLEVLEAIGDSKAVEELQQKINSKFIDE